MTISTTSTLSYLPCKSPSCVDVPFYFFEVLSLTASLASGLNGQSSWFLYLAFFGGFTGTHVYVKRISDTTKLVNQADQEIEEIQEIIPNLDKKTEEFKKESDDLERIEKGLKEVVSKDLENIHEEYEKIKQENEALISKIEELMTKILGIEKEKEATETLYKEVQLLNKSLQQFIEKMKENPDENHELDALIEKLQQMEKLV